MARLTWGDTGERFFETGVDRGVLYVGDNPGVPWNGLISVDEKPSGASATPYYIDGERYYTDQSAEEFAATINAFTYPDEFGACDGSVQMTESLGLFIQHQPRKQFSMTYRTLIGNDTEGTNLGYKIHLLYNLQVAPTERQNNTVSESPSPNSFSWDVTATPPVFTGYKPSAHLVIDSRTAHPNALSDVEGYIYGSSSGHPQMPDLATLVSIFEADATLRIADNGDGTWTATTAMDGIIGLLYPPYVTTVIDNFDGDSLSGHWTVTHGDTEYIVVQGSLLNLEAPPTDYINIQSDVAKNLSTGFFGFRYSSSQAAPDISLLVGFFFGAIDGSGNTLEFDVTVADGVLTPYVAGDTAIGSSTTNDATWLSIIEDGGWIAFGNIGSDNIIHVYKSSDAENWTSFASVTYTGTFDKTSVVCEFGAFGSGANDYASLIDELTYFTPQPDPPTSDPDHATITWDSVVEIDANTYSVGSL